MLSKLKLLPGYYVVRLSEPLLEADNSLKPLERAYGFIVHLDLFGADSCFVFELSGRHEEIEQRYQRAIDSGEEGLLMDSLKPVIAGILTDNGTVFLLNEAVVVFLACIGNPIYFSKSSFG
jgi:hypothetical protein